MRTVLAACALALAAGCGSPLPLKLDDQWPKAPRDYVTATQAWTRSNELIHGWDKALSMRATFLSPEWRTAYVNRRARLEALPPQARKALLEAQRKAHAEYWELHLRVSTYVRQENDLHRPNSVWRLALFDDRGRQVTPLEIKRDRRPRQVIKSWFPDLQDFDESYFVRFPRTLPVLRDSAQRVVLRISGAHGAIALIWK